MTIVPLITSHSRCLVAREDVFAAWLVSCYATAANRRCPIIIFIQPKNSEEGIQDNHAFNNISFALFGCVGGRVGSGTCFSDPTNPAKFLTTSDVVGRLAGSIDQHICIISQTSLDNPSSRVFSGLSGRMPSI